METMQEPFVCKEHLSVLQQSTSCPLGKSSQLSKRYTHMQKSLSPVDNSQALRKDMGELAQGENNSTNSRLGISVPKQTIEKSQPLSVGLS